MTQQGDKIMRSQRQNRKIRKLAKIIPSRCPKCGMVYFDNTRIDEHYVWCEDWTGMLAGRVK